MNRIPMPGVPGSSFKFGEVLEKGANQQSQLMNQLLGRVAQQQQLAQAQQQHQDNLALKNYIQNMMQKRHEENIDLKRQELPHKINQREAQSEYYKQRGQDYAFKRDPEAQQAFHEAFLKNVPSDIEGLENAVPMYNYGAHEKNAARKRMNDELANIQTAKSIIPKIDQVKDIMKKNPDLYRKAVGIIVNPHSEPGKIDSALRAFVPEEQLTAFIQAHKIYSDILTKLAQKNNMSRSVYALRLQADTKPQAKNPDEANMMMFENILKEIKPQIAREKPLKYALQHNLDLPYSVEYEQYQSPQEEQQNYSQEDLEYTANKRGMTVEQVKQMLRRKNA